MEKEILEILEEDARVSPEKIATMLNLNAEEVTSKIAHLEKEKVIVKYKTIVNWEKVEEDMIYAFIEVKVIPERDVGFDSIAKRIYQFPEVHSLYLMSGDYDFAVVVKGKNMKEVAFFVAEKLAVLPQVQSTATHFLLKKYKVDGEILVKEEENRRLAVMP